MIGLRLNMIIRKRQKCEDLNRKNHQNYSRYDFSTAEVILNWNVESDEVLCASLGFTSIKYSGLGVYFWVTYRDGYGVGDGYRRQNVLVTSLRCW